MNRPTSEVIVPLLQQPTGNIYQDLAKGQSQKGQGRICYTYLTITRPAHVQCELLNCPSHLMRSQLRVGQWEVGWLLPSRVILCYNLQMAQERPLDESDKPLSTSTSGRNLPLPLTPELHSVLEQRLGCHEQLMARVLVLFGSKVWASCFQSFQN